VMRCAAARHHAASQRDTELYETAESVVRAARAESSSWTARLIHDLDNGGSAVAQGVSHVSGAR